MVLEIVTMISRSVGGAIPLTAASSADRGSDDTSGWAGFLQTGD